MKRLIVGFLLVLCLLGAVSPYLGSLVPGLEATGPFDALVVEAPARNLPAEQIKIFTSPEVRRYVENSGSTIRFVTSRAEFAPDDSRSKALANATQGHDLPAVALGRNGKPFYVGPLPADVPGMLALLKHHGG